MERATSPESHMEPKIFIIALGSGLIGVIFVGMVIYLGCNSRRTHRISQQNPAVIDAKTKDAKKRSNSIESNHIERYPPKYPSDLFYPLDQSGSNSSSSQYRVRMELREHP